MFLQMRRLHERRTCRNAVFGFNWLKTVKVNDVHDHGRRGQLLAGLVVKASASGAEHPGFESRLRRDFFRVESFQ